MVKTLFDIHYKTLTDEYGIVKEVSKDKVDESICDLFNKKSTILVFVTKHNDEEIIFSHNVFSGTTVYEKDYKAPSMTVNGFSVMKSGEDGERKVRSKYPRWEFRFFEYTDGELDIDKLLK